jgi:hypothetical protein
MIVGGGGQPPAADTALRLLRGAVLGRPPDVAESVSAAHLDQLEAWGLDSLHFLAFEPDHPRQRLYDTLWALQAEACDALQAEAAAEGIECLVFKGAAHARRWFGAHALGAMTDIDLLVRRTDVVRIIPILYRNGYAPGVFEGGDYFLRDVQEIGSHEAEHYELSPYNRPVVLELDAEAITACQDIRRPALHLAPAEARARIEFDVHHAVASDVDSEGFFERAVGPAGRRTFSDADHLWFGLSRLYTEAALYGKGSLRDLAYLGPLVARGGVDWTVVISMAAEYELRPAIYYFLAVLDELAGGVVSPEVLADLSPMNGLRYRDWGWQIGKLLGGLDPAPQLLHARSRSCGSVSAAASNGEGGRIGPP